MHTNSTNSQKRVTGSDERIWNILCCRETGCLVADVCYILDTSFSRKTAAQNMSDLPNFLVTDYNQTDFFFFEFSSWISANWIVSILATVC